MRIPERWRTSAPGRLAAEMMKFGVVGVIGWVVDVGVFNLLRAGSWSPLHDEPLVAKILSITVATAVTWVGNRSWTFERHEGRSTTREAVLFAAFSLGGMVIATGCLWFSHYVLGLQSALADNVSANVVGFALATAFRFTTYRRFVFRSSFHAR